MSVSSRVPACTGRLVEPDGLGALRLALAMVRDPELARVTERAAFRSVPRPRSASSAGTTPAAPASGTTASAVAVVDEPASPTIPSQGAPSEPTGELATVMDIVRR